MSDTEETKDVIPRNPDGTLKKGAKLGKGRIKGSKNRATILRERMENKVSIKISKATPKIVDKVITQALDGDRTSQKLIMERAVPVKKADDGQSPREARVEIVISNLTRENVAEVIGGAVVDGEFEEIKE